MGMVANIVNYFVARRLPAEHSKTEAIEDGLLHTRARLQKETNELLHELINRPALLGEKINGTVVK